MGIQEEILVEVMTKQVEMDQRLLRVELNMNDIAVALLQRKKLEGGGDPDDSESYRMQLGSEELKELKARIRKLTRAEWRDLVHWIPFAK